MAAAVARCIAAALVASAIGAAPALAADGAAVERGAALFAAAGCVACHTDAKNAGKPLAGGRPLVTPFGTFFGPNITPDPQHGVGAWSEAEFRRALREGIGGDGEYLFPVFPFTSFTGMSDQDVGDLYAYLMTQPPADTPEKAHAVGPPFGWRSTLFFWRLLFFTPGPLAPVPGQSAEWNRGRYLAEAVAHCEECHTPRNFMGALQRDHAYAGNPHGPDGQKAPNITSDAATGIGKWNLEDVETVLKTGQTPDFDYVGSGMAEVVKGTGQLSDADRHAIALYVKSLPPLPATPK
jgi:mono/diheme cytochrome c family protein